MLVIVFDVGLFGGTNSNTHLKRNSSKGTLIIKMEYDDNKEKEHLPLFHCFL